MILLNYLCESSIFYSFFVCFFFFFFFFLKGTTGFGTNTGGLFGQQNQQTTSLFSKPFGQATTTPNTGFSFGNTSTLGQPSTNTMVRPWLTPDLTVNLSNRLVIMFSLWVLSPQQFFRAGEDKKSVNNEDLDFILIFTLLVEGLLNESFILSDHSFLITKSLVGCRLLSWGLWH